MKRLITILFAFTFSITAIAQAPEGINYQAVARDGNGDILTNQSLTVRLTIKENGPVGTTVYQETHNTSTNDFGLFSLTIGQGSVVTGSFPNIDWGTNSHFLQVEVDPGSGYVNLGTTQFVSVPYALYAKEAGGSTGGDNWGSQVVQHNSTLSGNGTSGNLLGIAQQGANSGQVLKWNGSQWMPGNDNSGGGSYNAGTGISISGTTITNTAPSKWNTDASGIHYTSGKVGIGINLPLKTLHVAGGGVLFGSDSSGAGTRLRWIPAKNAFRSGEVQNSASSVWDWDSIGHASFAHGDNVLASGESGIAIGSNVRSRGFGSFATGYGVVADGDYTFARGVTVNAIGQASQASGSFAFATGDYSLALGTYDTASDRGAIAIGYVTAAQGEDALAIGTEARAVGNGALAIGDGSKSLVGTSTAIGYGAWATDFAALSVGRGTEANAEGSLAIGLGAKTEGNYSYSIGWNTLTSDVNGVALGTYDTAGEQATAIGFYSSATGQGAIGMGRVSRATGTDAIAMGKFNRAAADNTIAIGVENDANSLNALTFGAENTADGLQSLAMGWQSQARGDLSMAIGDGALADGMRSIALGSWNVGVGGINSSSPSSALFEIGNGINSGSRSNAFTILKNGNTGIGLANPQHRLTVPVTTNTVPDGDGIGIVNMGNSNYWNLHMTNTFLRFSYNNATVAYITTTGTYTQTSDARLKTNITSYPDVLDRVIQLNVVNYAYRYDKNKERMLGLIAQETKPLFPELVIEDEGSDYMGINYSGLGVVAIKAIQEQQEKIEAQDDLIMDLQERITTLENRLSVIESQ